MWVQISYSDGVYSMVRCLKGAEGAVLIEESVWRAYEAHLDQSRAWQTLVRLLDEKAAREGAERARASAMKAR